MKPCIGRIAIPGIAVLAALCSAAVADTAGQPMETDVFVAGTGGYHTYRIPALIATKQGTLLAFCEGRRTSPSDDGDNDLLLRRSTDGGATWGPLQVVYEEGGEEVIKISNPCPVVDQTTGTIWLPFNRMSTQVLMTHSRDDGQTWSKAVDITTSVGKPNWGWYATGPGVGIQIEHGPHKGRLVIPANHRDTADRSGPSSAHVIYSDDYGKSWQLGGTVAPHTNECQVAETVHAGQSQLLINMRNHMRRSGGKPELDGWRMIARSGDGGLTWSESELDRTLIEPTCQASLLRYTWPETHGKSRLLFANPASRQRQNMTVRLSYDEGRTWPASKVICKSSSGYCCLGVLSDQRIGLLYERDDYTKLTFARFTLPWLTEGKDSLAAISRKPEPPKWKTVATKQLEGLSVSLSEPVLVARRQGYLWFPSVLPLAGGDILAVTSNYADVHTSSSTSLATFSGDGGLTWSEPQEALYGDINVRRPNGDQLLLPYYLRPRAGGMGGPYQLIPKGTREIRVVKDGVMVTGWPREDQSLAPELGLSGFVFNGQTIELPGGGYLATLYGYFKGAKRLALVIAESTDGSRWRIRATIADEKCKIEGSDGPSESAICRLKDGRLMCIFRLGSYVPYGQTFSNDDGRTWTEPVAMNGQFSVQPSLQVFEDGMVVLSGGRPDLYAWFNVDGSGKSWQQIDILAHHNACHPQEPMALTKRGGDSYDGNSHRTSSYTEVLRTDDGHLLYIYDRVPFGWQAIPKDSDETNSVWVVRMSIER